MTRACRGYGLAGTLIALALGALAVAASVAAYGEGRALHRRASELGRLNERAQYALSVLEPDLQMAGIYGFATDPAALRFTVGTAVVAAPLLRARSAAVEGLPASAQRCGNNFAVDVLSPLQVLDAHHGLPCAASGGGAMPGTDILVVRRASASPAPASAGRIHVLTNRLMPDNQLLFVGPQLPAGLAPPGAAPAGLRDLLVHAYYVAQRADGADPGHPFPALRIKALSAIAAAPAFIDTEVVSGIEDLQVQLGYVPGAATAGAAPRFARATALPAQSRIVAVRLWLRLRAEAPDPGYIDSRSYDYAGVRFTPRDHFQRVLVMRTVALRNPLPAAPGVPAGA